MTPEKAIKFFDEEIERLERAPIINGCEMTDDWRGHLEICKLAKSALEKQIPKVVDEYKVFEDGTLYNIDFMCPACGWAVIGQPYEPNFCKHCGQALDWSETE